IYDLGTSRPSGGSFNCCSIRIYSNNFISTNIVLTLFNICTSLRCKTTSNYKTVVGSDCNGFISLQLSNLCTITTSNINLFLSIRNSCILKFIHNKLNLTSIVKESHLIERCNNQSVSIHNIIRHIFTSYFFDNKKKTYKVLIFSNP